MLSRAYPILRKVHDPGRAAGQHWRLEVRLMEVEVTDTMGAGGLF